MKILVTNDDGIDSVGLHVLARAMRPHGQVTVVAPATEFSGAGCSIGALHLARPDVHRAQVEGIDTSWSVAGPPALCVMFARLGAFGDDFDLVVSGINPGANVGRAVYMSGTIGATLSARMGGITGVAVSQATEMWGIEGQGYEEMLVLQKWDAAAAVAAAAVGGLVTSMPDDPQVININVPNLDLADIKGVRRSAVGGAPPRKMAKVALVPKPGHEGTFNVEMNFGESLAADPDSDTGAVQEGYVSISTLSHLTDAPADGSDHTEQAIREFLT